MNKFFSKKLILINQMVLSAISARTDAAIIKRLLDTSLQIFEADFGFSWFYKNGAFELAYTSPSTPYWPPIPRKKGVNYRVLRSGKPLLVSNVQKSKIWHQGMRKNVSSGAIIPMRYKKNYYGNLIICFKRPHHFSKGEKDLCVLIGHTAASSITINRLYNNLADFKLSLDQTLDSIFIFDARSLRVEYVNEGASKLLGIPKNKILGKHIKILEPKYGGADFQKLVKPLWSGKEVLNFETELVRRNDGKVFPVDVFLQLIRSPGKPPKFLCIVHDASDRKKTEQEMQKLLQQKDEFLGLASHELRTPVTTIKGFAQLVQKRVKGQDRNTEHFLKKINDQVDKLTRLVNELLDVSRIEAGKLTFEKIKIDINELVKEAVEDLQFASNTQEIMLNGRVDGFVVGDKYRLSQVLINIINNAIKYSPKGDKIIVRIGRERDQAVVSVQDFGEGIPERLKNHVFERFFQGRKMATGAYHGLGLGLYISQEIMRRHRGDIWFESAEGQGTTFYFSLPIYPDVLQKE